MLNKTSIKSITVTMKAKYLGRKKPLKYNENEILPHKVLFDCESLLQEIRNKYPESLSETFNFLSNVVRYYKENRDYKTKRSIEQEYVVEETNG